VDYEKLDDRKTTKVAKALADIVTRARQVDELAAEVASASSEQTQGITQINLAVSQMDKVIQANAASAEESAAAAEELNAQAESVKASVVELRALVGGRNTGAAASALAPGTRASSLKSHVAVAAPSAPGANGHPHSSNGRPLKTPAVKPAPASVPATAQPRSGLPLEADFKDF
jgi:methyl-accepting chemotaxis protein